VFDKLGCRAFCVLLLRAYAQIEECLLYVGIFHPQICLRTVHLLFEPVLNFITLLYCLTKSVLA